MSRGKSFSKEELEYIKVHSLDMSIAEIAKNLGRNYWSIHRIMQDRYKVKSNHMFTADEDFIIRKLYKQCSIKFIATKLGVDEMSIYNRAKKLRISKNATSKTKNA